MDGRSEYNRNKEEGAAGGIKTGDAVLNEIPGNKRVKIQQSPKCPGKPPLTNLDIQDLTGAFELNGLILATQARIEGMKARNKVAELEKRFPQYDEDDFKKEADFIKQHAGYLRGLRETSIMRVGIVV